MRRNYQIIGFLALVAVLLSGCSLGPAELLIILAIVVLLFGATRLPQLGAALGETVRSFRKSSGVDALEDKKEASDPVRIEDAKVDRDEDDKK